MAILVLLTTASPGDSSPSPIWVNILAALAPILVALLAGIGWLYRNEREHRREIENQLSEKKYEAYIGFIELFFDIIKMTRTGKSELPNINERMIDINKNLIIYGDDDVIREWEEFQKENQSLGRASLFKFAELLLSIRRDMGHPNTKITSDDVLRPFIKDYDSAKAQELELIKSLRKPSE